LRFDVVAGITLAAYAVPVSLAYAGLAGLPPQTGLYCYLLAGLGYVIFGSSQHLAVGPTSAISLLLGVTLAGMAVGNPARQTALAPLTALIVAGVFALAWLLRLSVLARFISESILTGFKAGAALVIASTQLPKLFGVKGGAQRASNRHADRNLALALRAPVSSTAARKTKSAARGGPTHRCAFRANANSKLPFFARQGR
jgi:MFS superfamily sulfate permease-like transporter